MAYSLHCVQDSYQIKSSSRNSFCFEDSVLCIWVKSLCFFFIIPSVNLLDTAYVFMKDVLTGLFQRAILQSGNALCPWSLRDDHRQKAGVIADLFECNGVKDNSGSLDSKALVECLQEAPVDKFVMHQSPGNVSPVYVTPSEFYCFQFFFSAGAKHTIICITYAVTNCLKRVGKVFYRWHWYILYVPYTLINGGMGIEFRVYYSQRMRERVDQGEVSV